MYPYNINYQSIFITFFWMSVAVVNGIVFFTEDVSAQIFRD